MYGKRGRTCSRYTVPSQVGQASGASLRVWKAASMASSYSGPKASNRPGREARLHIPRYAIKNAQCCWSFGQGGRAGCVAREVAAAAPARDQNPNRQHWPEPSSHGSSTQPRACAIQSGKSSALQLGFRPLAPANFAGPSAAAPRAPIGLSMAMTARAGVSDDTRGHAACGTPVHWRSAYSTVGTMTSPRPWASRSAPSEYMSAFKSSHRAMVRSSCSESATPWWPSASMG